MASPLNHQALSRSLGLSSYEGRAYFALLELGEARASQLATIAHVPRGRIYDVVEALHDKALVTIVPSKPKTLRPVPLRNFLETRKRELRGQQEELERMVETLSSDLSRRTSTVPSAPGEVFVYRGRKAIASKLLDLVEGADREVLLVVGRTTSSSVPSSLLGALERRRRRGVRVQAILDAAAGESGATQGIRAHGEVRYADLRPGALDVWIADESGVMIAPSLSDPQIDARRTAAMWSDDPAMVRTQRMFFDCVWGRAAPSVAGPPTPDA